MIDSHCHLYDERFAEDIEAVIQRARETGVSPMICVSTNFVEGEQCVAFAEKYSDVFATLGVHPHHAKEWTNDDDARLEDLINKRKTGGRVVGVGEIGLDYHYDHSPRDVQQDVFRRQLIIAKKCEMPVVLHCRDAIEDVWKILQEVSPEKLVVHCCSEKWEDVEKFVAKGYMLSFTGIATYPNADVTRNTIEKCPLTHMMIETDAPYLAPIPHRGKRNEPAFVTEVAKTIAQIKGISIEEVDRATTANAVAFFGLPQ